MDANRPLGCAVLVSASDLGATDFVGLRPVNEIGAQIAGAGGSTGVA